jgi:hypothetical protein
MRVPFLFAGIVERPRRVLESYNYQEQFPLFVNPEDAVRALRLHLPELTEVDLQKVNFGSSICGLKHRGEFIPDELIEADLDL